VSALALAMEPAASGPRRAWRRIRGALALLGVTLLLVAVGYEFVTRPIGAVRIVGEFQHVARAELEQVLKAQVGRGFFGVDVAAVRASALRLPWVREVSVRRMWPAGLRVRVVERVAAAYWNDDALLDPGGVLFTPERRPNRMRLPRLTGPAGSYPRVLRRYRALVATLGGVGGGVRRLALSPRGGWVAELGNGVTLVLGRDPDGARTRGALGVVAQLLGARMDEIDRIDLRYANGFAVRWRRSQG